MRSLASGARRGQRDNTHYYAGSRAPARLVPAPVIRITAAPRKLRTVFGRAAGGLPAGGLPAGGLPAGGGRARTGRARDRTPRWVPGPSQGAVGGLPAGHRVVGRGGRPAAVPDDLDRGSTGRDLRRARRERLVRAATRLDVGDGPLAERRHETHGRRSEERRVGQ